MRCTQILLLGAAMLAGCTAPGPAADDITKDDARAANKADWPFDFCEEFGWYGDDVCDDFCPLPDPDCGPVERTCGGFLGVVCADSEYCDYDESLGGACGIADGTGTCRERPTACTREFAPVCGCDGRTYGNACDANAAGTDVAADGACDAPDCPLTGIVCDPECPDSGRLPGGAPCQRGTFNSETCECEPPPPDCPLTGIVCDPECPDSGRLPSGAPCERGTFNSETCECEPPPPDCPLTGVVCDPECPDSGRLPSGAPCERGTFNAETCECVPSGDCRSTGCDDGESCQYCWGSFACIPDGALC